MCSVLQKPVQPLEKDAARYGATRRALMLAGMARSLAGLAASAFVIGPRLERAGSPVRWFDPVLAFAGLNAVEALVELPVDYIEHFRLERAYGMSEQRLEAWLGDRVKALLLTTALGGGLLAIALAVVRRAPRRWPWIATAALGPFQVLAQLIAPTFIAPLFNKFTPLEGPLEERLRALAARYGVGDAAILSVDMSRRTAKANAYVVGLLGTHRIVIGDTLLDGFAPDEVEFVVAHELGHYVHRDTWKLVGLGTAAGSAVLFVSNAFVGGAVRPGGANWMLRIGFYASLLSTALGPLIAAFARAIEWQADDFALAATKAPRSGVAAFTRLREKNLAEDEQPAWMELLFSTHPSLKKRIAALQAAAATSAP